MSPLLWPLSGHTSGPHHITAAVRNSQSLGKGVKNTVEGGGEKQRRSVCVCGGGVQKQRQNLKTKFTTEGKQRGSKESVGEERKRKNTNAEENEVGSGLWLA